MLLDVRLEQWVEPCIRLHTIYFCDLRFGVARQLIARARAEFENDAAGGGDEGGGGCFFLMLEEKRV